MGHWDDLEYPCMHCWGEHAVAEGRDGEKVGSLRMVAGRSDKR